MTVLQFKPRPWNDAALEEIVSKYRSGEYVEIYVTAVTSGGQIARHEILKQEAAQQIPHSG
jgi:hypothetical protein